VVTGDKDSPKRVECLPALEGKALVNGNAEPTHLEDPSVLAWVVVKGAKVRDPTLSAGVVAWEVVKAVPEACPLLDRTGRRPMEGQPSRLRSRYPLLSSGSRLETPS
jgi:hypothetical protein